VYIWAPEEEGQFQPGRCSRWWLFHSLAALQRDLSALGSRLLCFRAADSGALLAQLAREVGAGAVVFSHLYDPISMVRDNEVKAGLAAQGIFCQSFNADVLREPWQVLDVTGKVRGSKGGRDRKGRRAASKLVRAAPAPALQKGTCAASGGNGGS
jgi:cryptochrome 1